jgi:acyl-CoA hydrolase
LSQQGRNTICFDTPQTEYGIVDLKGKRVPERARALIDLAHPDVREDLERQARAPIVSSERPSFSEREPTQQQVAASRPASGFDREAPG